MALVISYGLMCDVCRNPLGAEFFSGVCVRSYAAREKGWKRRQRYSETKLRNVAIDVCPDCVDKLKGGQSR